MAVEDREAAQGCEATATSEAEAREASTRTGAQAREALEAGLTLSRREFLRAAGVALAATGASLWLAPRAGAGADSGEPLFVVVFLRGGADGLHLVPPTGDPSYTRLRGALAISNAAPFVPGFGLHPELAPLAPLAASGELAVIHAAGLPSPTRSHFEAQDLMELGVVETGGAHDGWLGRALGPTLAHAGSAFGAVALGPELPLGLRGSSALSLADPARIAAGFARPGVREGLSARYAGGDDLVRRAGRGALAAAAELMRVFPAASAPGSARPRQGQPGGRRGGGLGLAAQTRTLGTLLDAAVPVRAAWLESTGWDSHVGQGRGGALTAALRDLGAALPALADTLRRRGGTALVMTEFGRTARPNGSGGTDHGHGSALLVVGPRVRGGVQGDWPGLAGLHEDRDLPVTNDWRDVAAALLRAQLGAPPAGTFPGFDPGRRLDLVRAA